MNKISVNLEMGLRMIVVAVRQLKLMSFSCILCSVLLFGQTEVASSQEERISLEATNQTLDNILLEIGKQLTTHKLNYGETIINDRRPFSFSFSNQILSEVLTTISAETGLTYRVVGNNVLMNLNQQFLDAAASINGQTASTSTSYLDEVVVIGYGVEKKKVTTAATSVVEASELSKTVNMRLEQALQGKTAGVSIAQNSGSPGSELNVRIRGISTPNNSDPLYVVDGVRTGGLDFLNPSDIERIDILKDAASAAIYGVAAANGVVLITTKGGVFQEKAEITYSAYVGWQQLQKKVELLDAYQYNEIYGFGAPAYSTDWQKAVIGVAPMMNHVLGVRGGTSKTSYHVSAGYFGQKGIVGEPIQPEKSNYERLTFRSNLIIKPIKRLKINVNLSFSSTNRRLLPENSDIIGVVPRLVNFSPSVPIYDPKTDKPYYDSRVASDLRNPVSTILTHEVLWQQFKTFDVISVDYELFKGLTISALQNIDYSTAKNKIFEPEYNFSTQDNRQGNLLTEERYEWYNWTNYITLAFKKKIAKDHNVNALIGFSAYEAKYSFLSATNTQLETNDFNSANLGIATGGSKGSGTGADQNTHSMLSFFGRLNYVFKEKYIVTSNLRVDGSSRFGPSNRYAILPSFSAGWVISDENFFKNFDHVVDYAKIRISWGQNGNNEIKNYGFYSQIFTAQRYVFGQNSSIETNGSTVTLVPNPELKWETSSQWDIGLDTRFFNNALAVTLDYYYKTTDDILVQVPIPGLVGLYASEVNAASVLNEGIELEINYQQKFKNWNYSLTGSFSYLHNEVVSLGNGGQPIYTGNLFHIGDNVVKTDKGSPIASFFGFKTQGVFQNSYEVVEYVGPDGKPIQPNAVAGDLKYQDTNGDGKLDDDDKVYLGKPLPDYIASLVINVGFKGFDFYCLLDASIGNSVYRGYTGYSWGAVNQPNYVLNSWTSEGSTTQYPALSSQPSSSIYNPESLRNSDFFVEDASFLKIRNIQLGYTFPTKMTNKVYIKSARLYVAVQNVFTITSYSGFDPEIGKVGDSQLELGVDKGFYPAARVYTVGVEIQL